MEETKRCPYCGEVILAVAKKCKHCGEWLVPKEPVKEKKMIECPICGEDVEEGTDVCPYCHERINGADQGKHSRLYGRYGRKLRPQPKPAAMRKTRKQKKKRARKLTACSGITSPTCSSATTPTSKAGCRASAFGWHTYSCCSP